ncbi:uncharacterized protein LOC142504369 [Primulina tabacum]|uniref:uncharacterized protein LOC142504369 n=1 Tax=Primulina tabacum TaxID=48773 RepID=UPI003F5AD1E5
MNPMKSIQVLEHLREKINKEFFEGIEEKVWRKLQGWQSPPAGVIKVNVDAFVITSLEYFGVGLVGRDSSGAILFADRSPTLTQSSVSSQSLQINQLEGYSATNSSHGYFEAEADSFRKALSTGDLQGVNLAPRSLQYSSGGMASESSIIESMNRASPYSPEEKKERIERYRSKKNLRNFNKKIKYECRKTLADSRPRIRGRFARNDELEKTTQEDHDEDDDNWIHFLDAFSSNM